MQLPAFERVIPKVLHVSHLLENYSVHLGLPVAVVNHDFSSSGHHSIIMHSH